MCCLCGVRIVETSEHVFPRCLFNKPLPKNLLTVPACYECNNALSKDEELFRVMIASGMAYETRAGNQIWDERIRPDLKGKRKGLKRYISSLVKQIRIVNNLGDTLGYVSVLKVNRDSVNRVLTKIAKGLYYIDTGKILPNNVNILFDNYEENKGILAPPLDEAIKNSKKTALGNGEVTYWRNVIKDNPEESLTWLRFYEDKVFLICTTRQDIQLKKPTE